MWRRAIRKPICGKKTNTAAVCSTNSLVHGTPLSEEVGESQWKAMQSQDVNGMVKARVAPATELLKDVVRVP
jgi:hypothetical protein